MFNWFLCFLLFGQLLTLRGNVVFSEAAIDSVKIGMTEAEVIRLLKVGPGDYNGDPDCIGALCVPPEMKFPGTRYNEWIGNMRGIAIWFNEEKRVCHFYVAAVLQIQVRTTERNLLVSHSWLGN